MNAEDALTEWRVNVRTVLNTLKTCGDKTIQETQLHLQEFLERTEAPSLHSIIHQLALGFLTTADCERGFSVLKLTKTALRMIREDDLNNTMLCNVNHISLHSFNLRKSLLRMGRQKAINLSS